MQDLAHTASLPDRHTPIGKMGYAGYVPAKYAPAAPTAVQAALYAVQSQEALVMIARLTKNVVVSPTGVLTVCMTSWDVPTSSLSAHNWR
jgi:hypothetical protein